VVRSATTIKIKFFQKCTIKNKEVEIMEGWCMSGYSFQCDNTLERGMHLLKEEEEEDGVRLYIVVL
jgi:hypothetical protein